MPILKRENDIYPENLFTEPAMLDDGDREWWCVYTLARREKELLRRLTAMKIPHYGPMIPKRYRAPNGRFRTSFIPLFPSYVFMLANEEERSAALTTNCISRCNPITEREQFVQELSQIYTVVGAGVPLTPEARLEPGNKVRVKSGPFAGYEGTVIRRHGKTRLLLSIKYLEQGVSMEMDEGVLEVQ
jgi:transcription antitermination factor NusG